MACSTEAVRQKPYSVILLDEVEKADPDVLNLFYQIFDKGVANDGEGREIDFRNTLILMTSTSPASTSPRFARTARAAFRRTPGGNHPAGAQPAFRAGAAGAHARGALLPGGRPVLRELIEISLERLGERLARRQLAFDCQPGAGGPPG